MDRSFRGLALTAVVLFAFSMAARAEDVPYISGGASAESREELLAVEKDYNLKIVTAEKSGDYLADVKVVIESAKKEQVLDTRMEGPILLARLPPGTYTIRATSDGQTLTRAVTIPARGRRQVDFRWPNSE